MIRNLKVLMAAMMALAAFGALSATAHAAEEKFHCSVEPCRVTLNPDGVGATSHVVILVKGSKGSFSTTCNSVTGEATSSLKTFTELTVTNIKGIGCKINGVSVELKMNGCDYLYTSAGTLSILCPEGKEIEAGLTGGCLYNIPSQGPLKGIAYHNITSKSEITVEMAVKGIVVSANSKCEAVGTGLEAEFTTGNTIWTSETDPAGVMANVWWE